MPVHLYPSMAGVGVEGKGREGGEQGSADRGSSLARRVSNKSLWAYSQQSQHGAFYLQCIHTISQDTQTRDVMQDSESSHRRERILDWQDVSSEENSCCSQQSPWASLQRGKQVLVPSKQPENTAQHRAQPSLVTTPSHPPPSQQPTISSQIIPRRAGGWIEGDSSLTRGWSVLLPRRNSIIATRFYHGCQSSSNTPLSLWGYFIFLTCSSTFQ